MDTKMTLSETVAKVRSWIESCTTHDQLMTCERFIGRHVMKRWPVEQVREAINVLKQSLQLQRVYIQASVPST